MDQLLAEYALPALFMLAFVAATLLPLGSEWLLALLVIDGHSIPVVVIVATAGNFLGACTTYLIGRWGSDFLSSKVLRIKSSESAKAQRVYNRWGIWSLFFSWLPIIGDPLCLAAGVFKTRFFMFAIIVIAGKALRYLFVAWISVSTLG